MIPARSILVAGVGNLLMTDDGLGCHLAAALKDCVPAGVNVVDDGRSALMWNRNCLARVTAADACDRAPEGAADVDVVFALGPRGEVGVVDFRWTHYGWEGRCRQAACSPWPERPPSR